MVPHTPPSRAQPSFHRRSRRILAGTAVVLVIAAVLVVAGMRAGWYADDDVVGDPVPTPAVGLTAEEETYYAFVTPRLHELGAQARELARLGEERSRNVFELQTHAGRLTELADEIDAYVVASGTPPRFAAVDASYREGNRLANRAMDEAERAILSADWERLGRVVAVFVVGAEELETAAALLDAAGGKATPDPAVGPPAVDSGR